MTILSEAFSLDRAPGVPVVKASPPIDSHPLADNPSDSRLLAWALNRAGFPSLVSIGNDAPVGNDLHPSPRFAVHLNHPVAFPDLTAAMNALRGKDPSVAVLLMSDKTSHPQPHPSPPYRERLHFHHDGSVLGIRRHFPRHGVSTHRPRLLGILWRIGERANTPNSPRPNARCWRTLRTLLRHHPTSTLRKLPASPHTSTTFRSTLLAALPAASLRALATHLGYPERQPHCFIHPRATIADGAHLRGPLFIDGETVIHTDHIHIGPGWITPPAPAFTLAAARSAGQLPHHHAFRHAQNHYFIGPTVHPRPRYDLLKRLFDFAFALVALVITLPICLAVALLIKLYDRGPIFFIHSREGRHARPFGCIKFRTMVRNAEAIKQQLRATNQVDGPQFKMANDPRITPIGRFLRKSNIDELPQLLNVLRGDMSIVGPRPSPFDENQLCPAWREARLSVKPGITGLWQISRSRHRGAADFQEWIFFDTQYVERRSLWLDLRILLLTIKELFGKGQ
jgi:lipopolysaccharide/colanic/teichoic acid biosynthesis glycosyltransferase